MPKRFHENLTDLLNTELRFVDDEGVLVTTGVFRRRFLTIVLALHRLGDLLRHTP